MTFFTAMTITARIAITGFLTVSCFKQAVIVNTAQVLSKAKKASIGLGMYSVCLSTITLVLAADKAAQRILSDETKHMPDAPKDVDADSIPLFANDTTTPAIPQPVKPSHSQPSSSQSYLTESTETITAPILTCTPKSVEPYHLQSSPAASPSHSIESTEAMSAPIACSSTLLCIALASPYLYGKRLFIDSSITLVPHDDDPVTDVFSNDASDANYCESFSDESSIHEDDRPEPHPRKGHTLEPTLDILIATITAPSKLRPLILVNNRRKTSTTIPCPLFSEPAHSMGALTRRMGVLFLSDSPSTELGIAPPEPNCPIDALTRNIEALSLGDRPSSASKLKPLILVTKHATRHFKLPPLIATLLRQPRSKTITQSQTYQPFSPNPTIWAHP